MAKKPSVAQIASQAGVSAATVSRVLNSMGGYSEETARKVRMAARNIGYGQPPSAGHTDSPLIGILVPDISNAYFAGIALALQEDFREHGFLALICNVSQTEELAQAYVDELLRQSVQALVFVCGYGWDLEKLDIPMVYIDRHPVCEQSDIIVVESDNVRGGYLAARELLRSGCRRIAFLTDSLKTSTKRSRYKGYVRALHQAGLEASDSLVISVGHQEEQQVRERIRQVLAQDPLIDGILCATDRLAIGAILGAQDCGRRIPEDLCVTGFDDGRIASVFRPGITSVRQDGIAMAKKASSILFTLLEGGQLDKRRYIIPVSLSVRESTCR